MIDCPMCDGEGGGEVDDRDARGEHRSRYVECPRCKGSGLIARHLIDPDGDLLRAEESDMQLRRNER